MTDDIQDDTDETHTLIIDRMKFPETSDLVAYGIGLGSWLTGQGTEYEVEVDDGLYMHFTMPARAAFHFKLAHSDNMISAEKLEEQRAILNYPLGTFGSLFGGSVNVASLPVTGYGTFYGQPYGQNAGAANPAAGRSISVSQQQMLGAVQAYQQAAIQAAQQPKLTAHQLHTQVQAKATAPAEQQLSPKEPGYLMRLVSGIAGAFK